MRLSGLLDLLVLTLFVVMILVHGVTGGRLLRPRGRSLEDVFQD